MASTRVRDIMDIVRTSGVRNAWALLRQSREVCRLARPTAWVHALIALEKCDLNTALASAEGVDLDVRSDLDRQALSTICEYLYETGVLEMPRAHVYRARNRRRFGAMLEAMYGCLAYHEPLQAVDRILRREWSYGRDVTRDDRYDAIASAALTSRFSYEFSFAVLARAAPAGLVDVGCGTGEYLSFLRSKGFAGRLCGMDLSDDAITEGKRCGHGSQADLFRGDLFELPMAAASGKLEAVDVVSFMFVLHEFDDASVRTALAAVRGSLERPRVLLTELIARSTSETRRERRTAFPELKLVHQLSGQRLRTPDRWEELFAEAGLSAVERRINQLTNHVAILFAQGGRG